MYRGSISIRMCICISLVRFGCAHAHVRVYLHPRLCVFVWFFFMGACGCTGNIKSPPTQPDLAGTVSWSQQPHQQCNMRGEKKMSTSDFFSTQCQLDDIMLTLPCLQRVHEIKPRPWPQHPYFHTHPLSPQTRTFSPCTTNTTWPSWLFLWC